MSLITKPISWIKAARKDFEKFPEGAKQPVWEALTIAAEGRKADSAKPMKGYLGDSCFPEKIQNRHENPKTGNWPDSAKNQDFEGDIKMTTKEKIELVRGSGNVFRDFGNPNADVQQLKALLAAEIIGILGDRKLSTRKAEKETGVPHADFVRIRKPELKRFTVDRLIGILNKLSQRVDVSVKIRPMPRGRGERTHGQTALSY